LVSSQQAAGRSYWTQEPVEFNGNKVYQRDDLIDPNYVDPKTGMTNLELMQSGRAPIGPDGSPINLHHMLQTQDGPVAELTQTFHQQNYSAIHINAGSNLPSGINRSLFNTWRSQYWMNRANDFIW
jgi:filamentous hemagglutinin